MIKKLLDKKFIFIGAPIIIISAFICVYYSNINNKKSNIVINEEKKSEVTKKVNKEEKKVEKPKKIEGFSVDIKGEINNPGVYTLESNKLVIDVINLAGGLTSVANTRCINLSKKIFNEMVIYVHSSNEIVKKTKQIKEESVTNSICPEIKNDAFIVENDEVKNNNITDIKETTTSIININSSTKEQLMTLSKIGEAKANSIIKYREENGNFKTIDDIKNVSGIGDSIFNEIKDYITV